MFIICFKGSQEKITKQLDTSAPEDGIYLSKLGRPLCGIFYGSSLFVKIPLYRGCQYTKGKRLKHQLYNSLLEQRANLGQNLTYKIHFSTPTTVPMAAVSKVAILLLLLHCLLLLPSCIVVLWLVLVL